MESRIPWVEHHINCHFTETVCDPCESLISGESTEKVNASEEPQELVVRRVVWVIVLLCKGSISP